MERDAPFDLSALAATVSLSALVARADADWQSALLQEQRLTCHFQPIVHAREPERVFGHECLARGLDEAGALLSPARLFGAARDPWLMFHLDRAARTAAIQEATRLALSGPVFINFNPTTRP